MENEKIEYTHIKQKALDKSTAVSAAFIRGYSTVVTDGDEDLITDYVIEWSDKADTGYISRTESGKDKSLVLIFSDSSVAIIKHDGDRLLMMSTDSASLARFFVENGGIEKFENKQKEQGK